MSIKESMMYTNRVVQFQADMMQPIPPEAGTIEFYVIRKKSLLANASYDLYIEYQDKSQIIMSAQREAFKGQPYYNIYVKHSQSSKNLPIGKLKTILKSKNKFTLYDSGENYNKLGTSIKDIRSEYATFLFWYDE